MPFVLTLLLPMWAECWKEDVAGAWVSRTVFVKSGGTLTLPRFQGIGPTGDIKVESPRLVEVSQQLEESYQAARQEGVLKS